MEYFVAILPFILLFRPRRYLNRKGQSYKDVIELIEGKEVTSPRIKSDLYKVAQLLLEVRKAYGAKAGESLMILKKEAYRAEREQKKLRSILHGAYFQQLVMVLLILAMILITNSMFQSTYYTYLIIIILQVVAVVFLNCANLLLDKYFVRGGIIRLKNILIISCLSQSGLSVGRVLKNIDWEAMKKSSNVRLEKWDEQFFDSLSRWQELGTGLMEDIDELDEELQFLRAFGEKKFQDFMNGAKFIALLIGGFLGYFVYLFSFVGKLLT